ncbi:MAG: tetratricopeptide repeat protein, partial [Planctomycetes bacterium]|nr:tetratricopeptide repeat protein [Planctomycetota bacterium]
MTNQSTRSGGSLLQAFFLVTFATLACFAPAHSAQDSGAKKPVAFPAEPGVPDTVRQALVANDWDRALAALDRAAAEQPKSADWWTYLRGTTLVRAKRNDAALAAFDAVEKQMPPSVWRYKARFARADLLRDLGRAKEAEAIYEDEAKRLLSEGRQEELAKVYFDAADELSTPPATPTPNAPPLDWNRAALLYRKVLELDVAAATRERALYRVLVCKQSSANPSEAVQVSNEYRNAFDPTVTKSSPVGAHLFEVILRRAQCQLALGMGPFARRDLEDLTAAIAAARDAREPAHEPWGDWFARAPQPVRDELVRIEGDAYQLIGATYGDDADSARLAVAAIERFLAKFPDHPKAAEAAQSIGLRFARAGLDEDASKALDAFLAMPEPANADGREAFTKLRMAALYAKGELLARQKHFDAAIASFTEYVARYSTGADWTKAQSGIIAAEFAKGEALRDDEKFAEARAVWNACLERYPLDPRAPQTLFDIGALFASEARSSQAANDPAKHDELLRFAVAQWRRVVAKYPGTDPASRALYSIGDVLENELGDLEGAVTAYRDCTFGASAGEARLRLARMTEPSMTLFTEHSSRTKGAPKIQLHLRNVEKLKLDLFALDLEAYFRKHLSHLRIEDLDLDLITPDQSLERAIDGYAKYKPIVLDLDLPTKGAGVWAIAVTAGELRATTLVVSSDLDVIVRSAAKELLVFAEDVEKEQPARAVRVLVAGVNKDGVPTVVEGVTGDDGTVNVKLDGFDEHATSVLAVRNGHYAASGGATRNASGSTPRAPRGVVYTDRPVYRPGELVHWRAILREVVDGRFAFEAGKRYDVAVSDAQGRVVANRKLALSEFGTLAGDVVLDELAVVGDWRIWCSTPNGAAFTGTFQVQQFQLPKVEVTLETPREVYFRGERVDVTARAKFYWGEPVANSKLAATLPDGRVLELTTDRDGKAEFGFETRDFASETALSFTVTLADENVTESDSVLLAIREFRATVTTKDDVVLAGTSFDVAVSTLGAEGKPTARALKLRVLRRQVANGRWTETQTSEYDVATDAEKGEAHRALALADGGDYVLRVEGVDRFGNPVSADRWLKISGDDDPQRLRWMVDTHVLEVGAKASLALVDRAADGLALLTIESDTFLEHRVLSLRKGTNAIELAIDHAHFPSFVASVAMMRPGVLYTDEATFNVTRSLRVTLEPERPDCKPGDEVAFKVTTLDQLGRPVSAELSLAVVDEAIYGLYGDSLPIVRSIFDAAEQRSGNFTTSSSATFRYDAITRTIAAAVLAEEARAKDAKEWSADRGGMLDKLKSMGYVGGDGSTVDGVRVAQELDGSFAGRLALVDAPASPASNEVSSRRAARAGGGGSGRGAKASGKVYRGAGDTVPSNAPALETFDTAHWSPSVVTDAAGKATVKVKIPERSTRW